MKKRILALILSIVMILPLLAGCGGNTPGSSNNPNSSSGNILDRQTVKISILRNLWSDGTGTNIEQYARYLEANFNCKFDLVTIDGSTAEAVIAGTENAVAKGANIILTTIADGLDQACNIAGNAGVAFGMAYVAGNADQRAILATYDNYIGTFCAAVDGYSVGKEMAENLVGEGVDNFGVVTFTPGLLEDVDTRTAGFTETATALGANIVYTLEEMPGSAMITSISTMLETYGDQIDYIIAYGGGTNFVVPALTASNYNIPIAVPQIPADYEAYFKTGILDYCVGFNDDIFGLAFAAGINYLNGQAAADTTDERIYECANVVFRSVEEAREYETLTGGNSDTDRSFYADEIKNLIVAYNPNASYQDIMALAKGSDLAGLKARHGG